MKKTRVELICVGSELLSHRVNTHTVLIGQKLAERGFVVSRSQTVGDDPKEMLAVFKEAWRRADVVLCAGGLGPTFDDITREVWAKTTGRKLVFIPALVEEIKEKFRHRGIKMPLHNRRQGFLLKGARVLANRFGTAPGQALRVGKKVLFLLPGPKRELGPMVEEAVLPLMIRRFTTGSRRLKFFHLHGVPESVIDEKIRPLIKKTAWRGGARADFGILASNSVITVKFSIEGTNEKAVNSAYQILEKKFRRTLKSHVFSEDDPRLEWAVLEKLEKTNTSLAVAESCTGGLISKMITDIPGASRHFLEGAVTYSNRSKVKRLGVKASTLTKWGAVSSQTAKEMAVGLKQTTGADVALSVTGIAGPEGGTREKPVGLVFLGLVAGRKTIVEKIHYKGDRSWVRQRTAMKGLSMIYNALRRS